ncbi:MAG: hypothetical protein KatS3mg105_4660 [Gemmatales bacterium]|nr:MAG: hypothetical protein KatS3mg105_4660 [Gemmatales bacterium]
MRQNLATKLGVALKKIHGHHIVQKRIPAKFFNKKINGIKIKDYAAPAVNWSVSDKAAWYIGKSNEILQKAKIPIYGIADFGDNAKALKALTKVIAETKKVPANLTYAYNGGGVHSLASQKAVYERIAKAAKGNPLANAAEIEEELRRIGRIFQRGKLPTFP